MTVNNSMHTFLPIESPVWERMPPPPNSSPVHTQYSAWSDLRMSRQLAGDFKVFEDPKDSGFVTLRHLEKMAKDTNLPAEVREFAQELLKRETLFDKLDSGGNKWLDNKISEQSIQDSIAEQRQAKPGQHVQKPWPGSEFPFRGSAVKLGA